MRILVINCGSSSIKYAVIEMPAERNVARGQIDRLGTADSIHRHESGEQTIERQTRVASVGDGVGLIHEIIGEQCASIEAVGHRVVHGGNRFRQAAVIDAEVLEAIESLSSLAPLHNPANAAGVRAARSNFPNIPHVAVFDTAFFQTLPAHAYRYAVPREWSERYGVRRYGFHGTSHKYVTDRAATILGREAPNLVTLHLGNGCSMACVRNGQAIDTTMGFTPLEGLVMGTRSGDIDAGVVLHLLEQGLDLDTIRTGLQNRGGLLGLSGSSHDVRDLLASEDGASEEAIAVFVHRVRKYLGAYLLQLPRCDAVVFTGGIGENAAILREKICAGLERFGIALDIAANTAANTTEQKGERAVHTDESSIAILIVPTNEELEIAKETNGLVSA